MKNKGFIQVVTILLAVVSIYQLSFTFVTKSVERKAAEQAKMKVANNGGDEKKVYKGIIDSLRGEVVYPVKFTGYTYNDCKQREINLGLDLQGGMNVTLEVSAPSLIKALAGPTDDQDFNEALAEADKEYLGQQNFVDLFAEKYEAKSPKTGLARLFYTKELSDEFSLQSSNEEVYTYLKKELKGAVNRTFQVVQARIDNFAVTQPNVQKMDNGRILVELPGVDNPDRVIKILSSSAKLEFWKTYTVQEGYQFVNIADKVVARLEAKKNDYALMGDSSNKQDSREIESISAVSSSDSSDDINVQAVPSEDGSNVSEEIVGPNDPGDTNKVQAIPDSNVDAVADASSDSAAKQNMTEEQFRREQPLASRIIPNASQTEWGTGAFVGWVRPKDKDFVKNYLQNDEVRSTFPTNVQFRLSYKTETFEQLGEVYKLYCLKSEPNGRPVLEGDVVADATQVFGESGSSEVSMTMNSEGAATWAIITKEAFEEGERPIAIVLDSQVYSAPSVQSPILDGVSRITGNFTLEEATDLANILKAGRLDAKAQIVEQAVVGPSLGAKSIRAGLVSLVIGFLMVIVFMLLYYARAGLYAVVALLTNLFFILGVLAGYGAALTLPGMAGLVLTIGMAVDANVLIFERIKEELATGKGFKAAIKNGYVAAYSSILDANVTTLIAAIFLMRFGKGPVAGFAIILFIGILSSLFTAIFLTRLFVERDIKKGRETTFTTGMSANMFKGFNFDFVAKRRTWYVVSGLIITAGIVSMFTRGLSTGVDLKGGWSYIVQVDSSDIGIETIKTSLSEAIPESVEVKTYGTDGQYKITTSYLIDSKSDTAGLVVKNDILKGLAPYKVTEASILSETKVGPTIAEDIRRDSTMAIVLSLIGMFIYIVLRFRKWGYGLGATIALFHDVLIVFSVFSIFHGILPFTMDIDQAFIAAILTVVGYSINDTVVVFDRVREFLGLHKYEKNTGGVINSAINQTLSRTMVTSFTTLIVVLILFLFGGEGLKGFTFALLVGVGVGTYSSIFIATPIVVDFTGGKKSLPEKE